MLDLFKSKTLGTALACLIGASATTTIAQAQSASAEAQPATASAPATIADTAVTPAPAPVVVSTPTPVRVIFPPSAPSVDPVTGATTYVASAPETLSARTLVRLEQLTRELSETIGRVEALEAGLAAQKTENTRLITLMDSARAAAPIAQVQAEVIADPAAAMAKVANEAPSPASDTAMFTAPTPPPIAPAIMLTNAQSALQTSSYGVAEANLTQLIWVYPTSPEASEGRWLLGEARFVQSAWGSAAQAYVDYLKVSPTGPRSNEALLRLAGAFRQLGDNRQRCVALAEFKRRTPRPDATLKARADSEIARATCPTS